MGKSQYAEIVDTLAVSRAVAWAALQELESRLLVASGTANEILT